MIQQGLAVDARATQVCIRHLEEPLPRFLLGFIMFIIFV